MNDSVFLLVKDPKDSCRDVIRERDGNMRISVYCLNKEAFDAKPEELQFYGENKGTFLGFETSGYDGEDPLLIIEAIRWYADYIGNPRMEILVEDPRINFK
ncbi:hypothetical protein [Rubrolithibacter danxiaensis]|uniref:hypothetical protein n=1 Tax=Rubrolithibacter danxiaensis TaxID=3390805 RepID=UPI003BF7E7DB